MPEGDTTTMDTNFENLADYVAAQQDALATDQPLSKTIQAWVASQGLSDRHKRWLNFSVTSEWEHEYAADIEWMSTMYFDSDDGATSDNDCAMKEGFVQVGGV